MTVADEAKQIRAIVDRMVRSTARKYPKALRARILTWLERAQAEGMLETHCAEAIHVPQSRFADWRRYAQRPEDWRPQPRAAKASTETSPVALVPVTIPEGIETGVTVVTPRGYRVEGLTWAQLRELLEVIS